MAMRSSGYAITEVTDLASFSELMRVIWTAYHQPYKPYFNAYNPVLGVTRADREEAILYSIETQWAAHQRDPDSKWICIRERAGDDAYDSPEAESGGQRGKAVVAKTADDTPDPGRSSLGNPPQDPKLGKIVAGCQWKFFKQNPYLEAADDHLTYDAGRWPQDSVGREFVTLMLKKHFGHQRRWLRRPHAIAYMMSVLPSHRRRGLASAMTQWGMERAVASGLEVFMHASDDSRWVYERHGLRVIEKFELDMRRLDASDEWEQLRHNFGPFSYNVMWKPVDGVYIEGQTRLPWELPF